ncbi:unnamed protein product [Mycena citricolor]|uniref:Uncharacterized protein n=1 Tax=Mycena citricolor TaxID=2018698 RepID=A0AAD2Q6Y3_9AGAR|nr:unnamed protein product [Mycena citricolor]
MGITPAAWPCASALLTKAKEKKRRRRTMNSITLILKCSSSMVFRPTLTRPSQASTCEYRRRFQKRTHLETQLAGKLPQPLYASLVARIPASADRDQLHAPRGVLRVVLQQRMHIGITRSLPASGSRAISRVSHEGYTTRVRTAAAGPNGGTRARRQRADSSSPS